MAHGVRQVHALAQIVGDQVCEHFSVGLGAEAHATREVWRAQGLEVLDDAVVHDGDAAVRVQMRVRVLVGCATVGRPARVPDARRGGRERSLDAAGELLHLAGGASDVDSVLVIEQRDARGVVSAILQPAQSLDDDGAGRSPPGVADDSAHTRHLVPRSPRINAPRRPLYGTAAAPLNATKARHRGLRPTRCGASEWPSPHRVGRDY